MSEHLIDVIRPYLVAPRDGRHRLFHGRGQIEPGLEWLTLDRYPPLVWATLFAEPPAGFLANLSKELQHRAPKLGIDCAQVQHRYEPGTPRETLFGTLPPDPGAHEAGLSYGLDFERGQNIGFFGDMAPGRAWLRERAAGCKVLNLFAFTCSFSVAALAGGAESVVNIDKSAAALELGRANHERNGQPLERVRLLPHEAFRSWKKLHSLGRYDIIVVDPPSRQKGSFEARRDYARLMRRLHKLLKSEAEVLACLNDPFLDETWLDATVLDNLAGSDKIRRLPPAPGFEEPGEPALKAVHYRYQRPAELDRSPLNQVATSSK
jgi:23S rRNA (cytosine1962-C5)-methyltransferase